MFHDCGWLPIFEGESLTAFASDLYFRIALEQFVICRLWTFFTISRLYKVHSASTKTRWWDYCAAYLRNKRLSESSFILCTRDNQFFKFHNSSVSSHSTSISISIRPTLHPRELISHSAKSVIYARIYINWHLGLSIAALGPIYAYIRAPCLDGNLYAHISIRVCWRIVIILACLWWTDKISGIFTERFAREMKVYNVCWPLLCFCLLFAFTWVGDSFAIKTKNLKLVFFLLQCWILIYMAHSVLGVHNQSLVYRRVRACEYSVIH